MQKDEQIIPKALIFQPVTPTDYVKGINSQIIFESRVLDGDWTPWISNYDGQKFKFDLNICSQYSGMNVTETQLNFLMKTGKMSPAALKWFTDNGYIGDDGLFDISGQFAGILSGTSIKGGSQWSYWQVASTYGILPRRDLHYSQERSELFATQEAMCADFYNPSNITQAMLDKAKKSLDFIQIQYEYLAMYGDIKAPRDMAHDLEQAPISVGVPVCSSAVWNTGNVADCHKISADHAIMQYKIAPIDRAAIRDHYNPMDKLLAADYPIVIAVKGVISMIPTTIEGDLHHTFSIDLNYGDQGPEVKYLQTALVKLGYLEMKYITGNFLDRTAAALQQFQYDKLSAWMWLIVYLNKGRHFSTASRAAMNKLFS